MLHERPQSKVHWGYLPDVLEEMSHWRDRINLLAWKYFDAPPVEMEEVASGMNGYYQGYLFPGGPWLFQQDNDLILHTLK